MDREVEVDLVEADLVAEEAAVEAAAEARNLDWVRADETPNASLTLLHPCTVRLCSSPSIEVSERILLRFGSTKSFLWSRVVCALLSFAARSCDLFSPCPARPWLVR